MVTDHSAFDYDFIVGHSRLVVDTRNATAGCRARATAASSRRDRNPASGVSGRSDSCEALPSPRSCAALAYNGGSPWHLSLVTGGAGFIGSHLVEALLARGDAVRVLDNFSTGSCDNLAAVRDRVEVIDGDITDPATVRAAMRGVEVVFHQAALASVPRSVANPLATHRVCVDGTLQVLLAARDAKVRRVVYAASSSAYGNSARLPKSEDRPDGAAVALRRGQAGRRTLLRRLQRGLRSGNGATALLQRLRPAADAGQPLRGGDPAVHPGADDRPKAR